MDLDAAAFENKNEIAQKLLKGVEDLHTYVERNREFVPNYGERYRNGEKIASGFVESAINQVVSKRMVKKQQMGWSPAWSTSSPADYEPGCSTKSGRTLSAAGIRISALKVKPRKRRDPPESPALRIIASKALSGSTQNGTKSASTSTENSLDHSVRNILGVRILIRLGNGSGEGLSSLNMYFLLDT